ncbi:hypothetical protein, partial [Vibrio sp. 1074]
AIGVTATVNINRATIENKRFIVILKVDDCYTHATSGKRSRLGTSQIVLQTLYIQAVARQR